MWAPKHLGGSRSFFFSFYTRAEERGGGEGGGEGGRTVEGLRRRWRRRSRRGIGPSRIGSDKILTKHPHAESEREKRGPSPSRDWATTPRLLLVCENSAFVKEFTHRSEPLFCLELQPELHSGDGIMRPMCQKWPISISTPCIPFISFIPRKSRNHAEITERNNE